MSTWPLAAFIEADIEVLPAERGGRGSPIWSGYRCNCWIGKIEHGERTYNDATFFLIDRKTLEPGERGRARVEPHFPDEWSDLDEGFTFELCEGRRVIGIATVTALFPPA
jgi:hypothetical protein